MQLARVKTEDGVITGEHRDGHIYTDNKKYELGREAKLLAPCEPSTLFCVGRNYAETLEQMEYERPEEPDWFLKHHGAVIATEDPIQYPEWTEELTYAGELAAVIDTKCTDIQPDEVSEVVRGYTIMNDVDALDQPGRTARKAFDGSAPLGPWIETDIDPVGIEMTTHINGEMRQSANTKQMLFKPAELISHLSNRYAFQPGDVVAFGSPANPGLIEPGDEVKIWYEGVGTLENTVASNE